MSKLTEKGLNERKELARKIAELAMDRHGFIPPRNILLELAKEFDHHYTDGSLKTLVLPWIGKQGYK